MFGSFQQLPTCINRECFHNYANECPSDSFQCPLSEVRPELENAACQLSENIKDTLNGLWSQVAFREDLTHTASFSIAHLFSNVPGCKVERYFCPFRISYFAERGLTRNPQHGLSKIRPLDFALIPCLLPMEGFTLSLIPPFIMMGMMGPAYWMDKAGVWSSEHTLTSLRIDLAEHANSPLKGLVARLEETTSGVGTAPLPEWLVLFGVIYDTEHIRIVAHIPIPEKHAGNRCVSYLVDELPLGVPTASQERMVCETTILLRVTLVLAVLRRHAGYMSQFLYGGGISQDSNVVRNVTPSWCSNGSQYMDLAKPDASTLASNETDDDSAEYSTCPSSTGPDASKLDFGQVHSKHKYFFFHASESNSERKSDPDGSDSLSCSLSDTSCCSSCSSLRDSDASDSISSERSWDTRGYMEPSTSSLYQEASGNEKLSDPLYRFRRLDEKKRAAIVAWSNGVNPSQLPEEDTYCIAVLQ